MESLLLGAVAMGSFLAGLFFLRFWHRTRDTFFLYFAGSFWMEAANRAFAAFVPEDSDNSPWVYGVRLVAYGLILIAIWQKNSQPRRKAPRE